MAKQQTFADKVKKKVRTDTDINVKVIKGYWTNENNLRFVSKFVRVKSQDEIFKINIAK
ncbi:MAG: hypothetical protein ACUVQ1_04510 [Candidatus Kapaibacteriales bacterium]